MLYKDAQTQTFSKETIKLKLDGTDENSRCMLAYLRGLLTRKDELAIVPIDDTTYQLVLFYENTSSDDDQLLSFNDDLLSFSTLSCILTPRYNMVFDLDETLIRTRMSSLVNDAPLENEHEFTLRGGRYFCWVRPGVDMLLRWSCQLFNVHIFTNAIYDYAVQIVNILDPKHEHLLLHVGSDTNKMRELIKSREQMTTVQHIPQPLGQKELSKFNINPSNTIIFDDDSRVWKERQCILPFQQIVVRKKPTEFFCQIRNESWKKLSQLHKHDYQQRRKIPSTTEKITFSQDQILQNLK
ncbi:hypothetical protein AKO1_008105 [Acrasis kona]|uniref:Mitochondrial import inner membrane translocase subunit TIM50 n=1 Tax=Acrasis kona TaxID=1008807 RepID=A0AAW2YT00_9EUKA